MAFATIAIASAIRFDESEQDNSEDYLEPAASSPKHMHKKNNFKVHVVKKRGRYGKVRQIHLIPVGKGGHHGGHSNRERDHESEERNTHSESETHSHINYNKQHEQEAADSTNVEKMIDVHDAQDNVGAESHHYEHKQKIKIKHHHHHHHHNHVKTVVKKEPYPVEKIVQVCAGQTEPISPSKGRWIELQYIVV